MVEYKLLTQTKYFGASNHCKTYGIIVFDDNIHIRTIGDISRNKTEVQRLIDKFNKYGLDPCHLTQAVEDYLYDLCID